MALGKTVEFIENNMSYSEFMEWHEFYAIDPFPHDKQEIQMATLSNIISAANGGKNKTDDFMLSTTYKNNMPLLSVAEMTEEQINELAGV